MTCRDNSSTSWGNSRNAALLLKYQRQDDCAETADERDWIALIGLESINLSDRYVLTHVLNDTFIVFPTDYALTDV